MPFKIDIYSVLLLFTSVQFIIMALFLSTIRKGRKLSNGLFALFLFSKGLCFLGDFVIINFPGYAAGLPFPVEWGYSFEFILGPVLLLYVKSLVFNDYKISSKSLIMFVPFILHSIFVLIKFALWNFSDQRLGFIFSIDFRLIEMAIIVLHFNLYGILSLFTLKQYRQGLRNNVSEYVRMNLNWLGFLLSGLMIIWLGGLLFIILSNLKITIPYYSYISLSLTFLFSNMIVLKGLKHPEIFQGLSSDIVPQKYSKTNLTDEKLDEYYEKILLYMKSEKPYLRPGITVQQLGSLTDMQPHHISQVINRKLNMNFYSFINHHRVEECKKIMTENSGGNKTISEIFYSSGFNSKAAFNNFFKKSTGKTPTEYISELGNN